ncbi:unnamed protein product [Mytilus coruscus]|uniref:Uncharacterized protein n=1 Tax=Mytilus coruscus TaxID=42192 RepID=A0A6J8AAB4_MYTCO|nr:unnamed protein product [Mytilus coruscus]
MNLNIQPEGKKHHGKKETHQHHGLSALAGNVDIKIKAKVPSSMQWRNTGLELKNRKGKSQTMEEKRSEIAKLSREQRNLTNCFKKAEYTTEAIKPNTEDIPHTNQGWRSASALFQQLCDEAYSCRLHNIVAKVRSMHVYRMHHISNPIVSSNESTSKISRQDEQRTSNMFRSQSTTNKSIHG